MFWVYVVVWLVYVGDVFLIFFDCVDGFFFDDVVFLEVVDVR